MIIFLIIAAALILRLINLNQSLWLDEAINVVYSQKYNFRDFISVYSLGDFHPPLHFALIWIWTRIFGISEIAVRIPSVVLGVITVWFTYLIGQSLFGKKTGLISAVILAFNPLHVYYSQEARMYSLAAFSAVFCYWAFINLTKGKKYSNIIYAFSVLLVLYADYLVYFVLVAQLIYIAFFKRNKLTQVLKAMFLGGIFFFPWLFIIPAQLKTGQNAAVQIPGWADVVGGANIKELVLVWVKSIIGRVSFENKLVYLLIVLPVSAIYGFVLFKAIKTLSKEVKLLLLWIIIPVLFAFLISFYIPILAYFRVIFILPGLALFLAIGITKFDKNIQKILLGLILGLSFLFLLLYYFDPKFKREDWKGAVDYVVNIEQPGKLIIFEDSHIPAPFEYYYPCNHGKCIPVEPGLKNFPALENSDVKEWDSLLIDTRDRIYLFDYLVEISDPNRLVARKLENLGFKHINTYNFNGVGFVYEYSN